MVKSIKIITIATIRLKTVPCMPSKSTKFNAGSNLHFTV